MTPGSPHQGPLAGGGKAEEGNEEVSREGVMCLFKGICPGGLILGPGLNSRLPAAQSCIFYLKKKKRRDLCGPLCKKQPYSREE